MSPKEKAVELMRKYYFEINDRTDSISWNQAKQCAIIAVNEIITSKPILNSLDYWYHVKQELKKL